MSRFLKTSFFMMTVASFAIANNATNTTDKAEKILAKINNNIIIKTSDVDNVMKLMPQQELAKLSEAKNSKIRTLMLQQVVVQKLMLEAAKKTNLAKDPSFKKMLQEKKNELLINYYMSNSLKSRITPQKIQEKMVALEKEFATQLERKVCMIAVKDDEVAKLAIADLDAGKDFKETAKKHSVFPTEEAKVKAADGMYLIVEQAVLFPADVKDKILALKVGEYTKEPISIGGSKFIVKVTDTRKTSVTKEELAQIAQQRLTQEEMKTLIDAVKAQNKIVYYNDEGIEIQPETISPEDLLKN